jgi:protein O-mannosyl-transferase
MRSQTNPSILSRAWLPVLLVACFAWLLYARMLGAGFVWDGLAKVVWSGFIHDPANLWDVISGRVIARDVLDNNRPGNLLSLMMDAAVWGKNPVGYHLTSITLHAAVCAMICLLALRLLPEVDGAAVWAAGWVAGVAALWYGVHPLNCEPVSEVSYREDLLVASSILVALFAAMEFLRRAGFLRNALLALICCGALLFGVSAKENGAAGPVILAAYWLLWRRKEALGYWLVATGAVVVVGFLWARFNLRPVHSAIFTEQPHPISPTFIGTLMIQHRVWAMELSQVFLPFNLCADYGPYSLQKFTENVSLPILGVFLVGQIWLSLRDRVFAFGSIWYWAGLLPVSNFVPLFRPMADRFMYVALTGLALMLARGLQLAGKLSPAVRLTIYMIVGVWICGAAFLTFEREAVWHDSLALWQATYWENPYSATAADNLGWAQLDANETEQAAASFQQAIQLTQDHQADPWAGLALAFSQAGEGNQADAAFARAVSLDGRYGHPQELVAALVIPPEVAGKLELLAGHNTKQQ